MNSRERVQLALNHREADHVPLDIVIFDGVMLGEDAGGRHQPCAPQHANVVEGITVGGQAVDIAFEIAGIPNLEKA